MISVELVCRIFLFVERNHFSKLNFSRKWNVEKREKLTSLHWACIEHKGERKISKEIKKVFLPSTIILLTFLMITFAVTLRKRRKIFLKRELLLCLSHFYFWRYVCIAVNFFIHLDNTPMVLQILLQMRWQSLLKNKSSNKMLNALNGP